MFLTALVFLALLIILARYAKMLLAIGIGVVILAAMFPQDQAAQFVLNVASGLIGPILLFWILWVATKTIFGIKPKRPCCHRE